MRWEKELQYLKTSECSNHYWIYHGRVVNHISSQPVDYRLILPEPPRLATECSISNRTVPSSADRYPTTYSSLDPNQNTESGFRPVSHFTSYFPLSTFFVGTRAITGWLCGDHHRTVGSRLVDVLINSCGVAECQVICRTGCSWTRADANLGGASKAHIQTTFGRMESTDASMVPSGLNPIIATPRVGPDDSGLMLTAEELDASAYSASPSVLVYLSRQMLGGCWSIWNTCESVVDDENC